MKLSFHQFLNRIALILFFFLSRVNCYSSDNFEQLKDLFKKSIQHGEMIKTIRMDIQVKENLPNTPERRLKYHVVYRRSDNHWLGNYEQEVFVRKRGSDNGKMKTITGIHEQKEDVDFIFHPDENSGVIEKTKWTGFHNISLDGISGVPIWGSDPNILLERINNGIYKISHIKPIEYKGESSYEIVLSGKRETLTQIIVPGWQYTIPFLESKFSGANKTNTFTAETIMKKNSATGIWFPSYTVSEMKANGKTTSRKSVRFENVVLNKPVSDDQVSFKIPEGANITNSLNKEIFDLSESSTMEDILSGKLQSVQEQTRPEITTGAKAGLWWRNVTSSMFFRIFLILALTGLLYIIISGTIKKVTSSSDD
mgnify:FL=1